MLWLAGCYKGVPSNQIVGALLKLCPLLSSWASFAAREALRAWPSAGSPQRQRGEAQYRGGRPAHRVRPRSGCQGVRPAGRQRHTWRVCGGGV